VIPAARQRRLDASGPSVGDDPAPASLAAASLVSTASSSCAAWSLPASAKESSAGRLVARQEPARLRKVRVHVDFIFHFFFIFLNLPLLTEDVHRELQGDRDLAGGEPRLPAAAARVRARCGGCCCCFAIAFQFQQLPKQQPPRFGIGSSSITGFFISLLPLEA
jgi:hypothetical protein